MSLFTRRWYGNDADANRIRTGLKDLGNTKVTDVNGTKRHVKEVSRGLSGWYCNRFFNQKGGSAMPVFHIALAIGILGYSWEYSHLKHKRDHPEEDH